MIINKDPSLLDNYLDVSTFLYSLEGNFDTISAPSSDSSVVFCQQEMLAFQNDKSIEVRKFVIGFIEEAW